MKSALTIAIISVGLLSACSEQSAIDKDFKAFDNLYSQAESGQEINCGKLLSTKGWGDPSHHEKVSHGASRIPYDIFDYMYETGKNFTEIPVCEKQIEAARQKTCDDLTKEILSIREKNKKIKESKNEKDGPILINGIYVTESKRQFCSRELIQIKF